MKPTMIGHSRFLAALGTAALALGLGGCTDPSNPAPSDTGATPGGEAPEPNVAGCTPEGFSIPEVAVGETIDVGGSGLRWELTCFVVDAPTRITVGAYPLEDAQDQLLVIDRLNADGEKEAYDDLVDPYRTEGWTGKVISDAVTSSDDAVGYLPRATLVLEPGAYLVAVRPSGGADEVLAPTRVFIRADGGNGIAEFEASGNPWVMEEAAFGIAVCSPQGYDIPEFHFLETGRVATVGGVGDEWAVVCFSVYNPKTIVTGAFPVTGEQDLQMEIVRFEPSGGIAAGTTLGMYRASEDALEVWYDSVLTADDQVGLLPWGQADLEPGRYLIVIRHAEPTPLEATTLFLFADGSDTLDEFASSTNPWVVANLDAYQSANQGG